MVNNPEFIAGDDSILAMLMDMMDHNVQSTARIIALLEAILEAILSIELNGELIARANQRYMAKMTKITRG